MRFWHSFPWLKSVKIEYIHSRALPDCFYLCYIWMGKRVWYTAYTIFVQLPIESWDVVDLTNKGLLIGENDESCITWAMISVQVYWIVNWYFIILTNQQAFAVAPINNIHRFCRLLNRNGIGCSPDHFSHPNMTEKSSLSIVYTYIDVLNGLFWAKAIMTNIKSPRPLNYVVISDTIKT